MVSGTHVAPKEPLLISALWVGLGCKQGTPKRLIEQAIRSCFQAYALHESAIAGVATIDTKRQEVGLIEFCVDRNLPLRFYTAVRLRSVAVPHPSSAINAAVGTPSVAEAAALLGCGEAGGCWKAGAVDESTAETQRRGGDMLRLLSALDTPPPMPILSVPKQCYRFAEPIVGAVTIAVAAYPESL